MMNALRQPPRLRSGGIGNQERHATWLELFYDLFFVVAVAELAHKLSENISLGGVLGFTALFIPVWWAWIGETFYDTRFDTDDVVQRLLTFAQMGAVVAIAVNIHDGLGATSAGFALAYAAVRAVLIVQYLRAGRHIVIARPLTRRFARGFALAAALWLLSAFVPPPWRFALWAAGIVVDFATPLLAGQLHARLAPDSSHLPERFGLFVIIVLGEAVLGVVGGVAAHPWNAWSGIAAGLGLSVAFSVWWIYFDHLDGSAIQAARSRGRIGIYQLWLYAHLPLVLSLAAAGVGVEHVITSLPDGALHDRERWLVCGAGALCLLALGLVHFATASAGSAECTYRQAAIRGASAGVLLLLPVFGAGLHPAVLIGVLAAVYAGQVVLDLYARQPATGGTPLAAAGQSQPLVIHVPHTGQPGDDVLEH